MKKTIIAIICLLLVVSIAAVAYAAGVNGDYNGNAIVNVLINGVKQVFPNVPAINYNGSTLLPLRAIVEGVNGVVEWDGKTQTARIIKPQVDIFFFEMNSEAITDVYSIMPLDNDNTTFYSSVEIYLREHIL